MLSVPSKPFAYIYDKRFEQHACPYDPKNTNQERSERTQLIYDRLQCHGLLKDAYKVETRLAEDWEIRLNHPQYLIDELEHLKTVEDCEEYCRGRELLWLAPQSLRVARLALGGVIDMVKANVEGRIGNGFAIIRPPGHHSHGAFPQGFCVFNNVAIAAKFAVEKLGIRKVLIVDVDYHCGNGSFHSLKDDSRFLYVNFFAHHHGAFWPYSEEYDYDAKDNVIGIQLNSAMTSEVDFMAAMNHVVLPIAKEFGPDLVLISAGFDSAYYDDLCELGQGVKAHGYGHIARVLNENWPNKVIAVLEGGYFPHSYTECATQLTRGLKGLSLPHLCYQKELNACMVEMIWKNLCHHSKKWKNAEAHLNKLQAFQMSRGLPRYQLPATKLFIGDGFRKLWNLVQELKVARTRDWISGMTSEQIERATRNVDAYIKEYDYKTPTTQPSEEELLEQMLWTSERAGEAYLLSIPPTLEFYNGMRKCIDDPKGVYLICDMEELNKAKRKCISNEIIIHHNDGH
ncbi:hypothetical protein AB6A40_002349 [Gnathostoma spinigerum]|uniref:Histone deacetylase domain-containing protein n=1 Tax=Gnathostoma spinigerum TaxID=75299 RepID=A0ABD6E7G1_9BILA